MITNFAEMLEAFIQKEVTLLDNQDIDHPPTIGAMYEGLTHELLGQAIPPELQLKVVSGFIVNDAGEKSKQIDCMLVTGEGKQVPYTDSYTYHISNVIAVLEVKKNLYSGDLESAYSNLLRVKEIHQYRMVDFRLAQGAYRLITGSHPPPFDEISALPLLKEHLLRALLIEEVLPVRIALGYHGFATENNFREAFANFLARHPNQRGYGPQSLPNLIVCRPYSIVKLNGMPYASPLMTLGGIQMWPLLVSYSANPLIPLLELIWTRLTFRFRLYISGYNDDLAIEIMKNFILTWAEKQNGETGWHYFYLPIDEQRLQSAPISDTWKPVTVNDAQAAILLKLIEDETVTVDDKLEAAYPDYGDIDSLIDPLVDARLVAHEEGRLTLLTQKCAVVALPNNTVVAGEDIDGRFSRWLAMEWGGTVKFENSRTG